MSKELKIAMIGGGGKNIGGMIFYLLNSARIQNVEFALFGRTKENMERNISLAKKIPNRNGCSIKMYDSLETVLDNADITVYCATAGYGEYEGYKSFGVPQGGHILHIGEKISKICPDTWFLCATNPPDVPLTAVMKRFGIKRSIGLCNAPMIVKNTLSAITGIDGNDIVMHGIGTNHDVWYYDFKMGEVIESSKIVETVKDNIDNPELDEHKWFKLFPEWKKAIVNNISVLEATGYLFSPTGGTKRMKGLPLSSKEYGSIMKRPKKEDFEKCMDESISVEEMLRVTGRCGGGVPGYTGRIIESIILEDDSIHSALVPNNGAYPDIPDNLHIQADISIEKGNIKIHGAKEIPSFIKGMLMTRFIQNDLLTSALALQDEKIYREALMIMPERYEFNDILNIKGDNLKSAEPTIPFN